MPRQAYPLSAKIWSNLEDTPVDLPVRELYLHQRSEATAWDYRPPLVDPDMRDYYGRRFVQGADLMPRTAVIVEEQPPGAHERHEVVHVRTSRVEERNHRNKVLADVIFKGLVHRNYLYRTVKSSNVLPFVTLRDHLQLAVLPMRREQGRRVLSKAEMIDRGDLDTAEWFDSIDAALEKTTIRERVDVRGKLTKQPDFTGVHLVQSGASGASPCASLYQPVADDLPFVLDQTLYTYATNDHREAYYLTGLLNSTAVEEQIERYQSRGDFGRRHIHKLPFRILPRFRPDHTPHVRLAEEAQKLEAHAEEQLTDYMLNLNKPLHVRRRKLRGRLDKGLLTSLNLMAKTVMHG